MSAFPFFGSWKCYELVNSTLVKDAVDGRCRELSSVDKKKAKLSFFVIKIII
jgi:hypothetical protein